MSKRYRNRESKDSHAVPKSIEKRIELLESRFTTPSSGKKSIPSSQEATLNPNSPGGSHHSFGFDPPAASTPSTLGGSSNLTSSSSAASQLDKSLIRSKRKSGRASSLSIVEMAAAKQMRKVMRTVSSPVSFSVTNQSSVSGLPSPITSNPSQSNQTLQTGHVSHANLMTPRIISESPRPIRSPVIVMTATTDPPKVTTPVAVAKSSSDKRKSVPVRRDVVSVTTVGDRDNHDQYNTPRKRTRLNFAPIVDEVRSRSPPPASLLNEHSLSNSSRKKGSKAPSIANNTRIHDFFSTVKKPVSLFTSSAPTKSTPHDTHEEQHEFQKIRQQCEELQRLCKEKDEQLKAVSNNQTIMHTALRSAMGKLEKEMAELKKSSDEKNSQSALVIEKLLRSESAREAKELQQKLASDSARLGRIVYTRAGMRAVESWEEGHASRLIQQKRAELKARQEVFARRQQEVFGDEENNNPSEPTLSVLEAQESLRLHLHNLQKEESKLAEEEHALNLEKVEHIRALKRAAAEEESRFRSRPKLNNRYVLLSLLGKGGFSEVWRAFDLLDLKEVAVKIHQLDSRWSDSKKDNYTKHVSREYEIHRDVCHPRIVSLYDIFEIDNNSFATVLELCKGTDLDSILKERRRLSEREARAILLQILLGMDYLSRPSGNRQAIIHYDLKPGNILFDEFGDVKITDFGLSKILDNHDAGQSMELTSQGAGTYWYLPPECFVVDQTVRISNKVDVWSIGVIFYQMIFGRRPFGDGMSQDKVLADNTMLNARNVTFPEKYPITSEAKDFIQQCLTYDQTFRPTIHQLCQHPYILGMKQNLAR